MLVHDVHEEGNTVLIKLNMLRFLVLTALIVLTYICSIVLRFYFPRIIAIIGIFDVFIDVLPFCLLFGITTAEVYIIIKQWERKGYQKKSCCWFLDTEVELKKVNTR
jgi:hypothetical protein